MFNSFRPVRLIRETSSRALDRRRFIKLVERTSSLFAGVNKLFYTEALTHIFTSPNTDDGVRWGFGSDLSSVLAYNGPAPFDYSSYSVACGSGTDTGISATQTPSGTRGGSVVFKAYDTVAGSVNSKSLWNHNQLGYTKDMFSDDAYNLYWTKGNNWLESEATWTNLGEVAPNGSNAYEIIVSGNSATYFVAFRAGNNNLDNIGVFDDTKVSMFSMYIKAPEDTSKAVGRFRVIMTDRSSPVQYPSIYWSWDSENSRWEEEPLTGQPASTRIAHTEDLGNGWQRITAGVIGSDYTTHTNSGDELEIDLRFDNLSLSANKGFIFAEPQFEQHPIRGLGDTNVYSGLDYAFEYDPDPHSGFAGTLNVWNVGNNITGSDTGFEYRIDPFGKESVVALLKDGGPDVTEGIAYNYYRYAVDRTTKHRVSFFFKRQRTGGTIELGMYNSRTKRVGDHPNYILFQSPQHPATTTLLNDNEWYLQVGYIHDTSTATTDATTGWYRLDGTKVDHGDINFADLYFDPAYPSEPIGLMFRRFSAPHNDGNEFQIFGPRIDVVNGNEPSIEDLLNPVDNVNYGTVTKATPYVGNDAVPANVHRHNWLNYTNDLDNTTYWLAQAIDVTPSTVGTTYANGETCFEIVHNSLVASQTSLFANRTDVNGDYGTIDENTGYIYSVYLKQHPTKSNGTDVANIRLYDVTVPQAIYSVDVTWSSIGAVPTISSQGGPTDYGIEEVADGWYRAWVYNDALNANTIEGDQYTAYIYLNGGGSRNAALEGKGILAMRPMMELVQAGTVINNVPTAYQEVPDNTWPSELQIPYHQTAKRLDITLTEETGTTQEYKGKFWWDGGYPYYYNTPSGAVNSIDALGDGWFRLHTAVPQAGAGPTARNDKIARFSLDLFTSANSATSALFAAPSLGHTGSEDIYKLPYEPGTNEPGVNYLPPLNEDTVGTTYIVSGTALSSLTVLDHDAPEGYSGILIQSDEGLAGQQNRDQLYIHTSALEEIRMSEYDTIVAQLPVKSLWNYNELPYTRNMLDDPGFNYEGDTNGEFYSLSELQYPVDETDKGPDGVSQALTFYNDHPAVGTRQFFDVGALSYIPSSTLHAWDENLVVNFSIHLKRPDNVEDTVPRFLLYLSDHTDPENTQAIYFDWGPSSTHPYHYSNNAKNKQVTFTDAGDGWYRVCWSVSGFGSDPNQKTKDGDKVSFRVYALDSLGKSIKYAQPQIEFHTINDTNLLKPSWDWYEQTNISNQNGWTSQDSGDNLVELREDPFGVSSLCWVTQDNDVGGGFEGGFYSPTINIDANSTYRYAVWARQNTPFAGNPHVFFGAGGGFPHQADRVIRNLDGSIAENPYFKNFFALPSYDEWYLLIGHVQASGTSLPATTLSNTGIYDISGNKVDNTLIDFVFSSTNNIQFIRAMQYSNPANGQGDEIVFWSPRIEKVDGTEPSITELLASGNLWTNPNYQQTLPSPYVENVGIHPNPHRHNWIENTKAGLLSESIKFYASTNASVDASTVGTTYANGENCSNVSSDGTAFGRLYYQPPGGVANRPVTWDEDNIYIFSYYIKNDLSNPFDSVKIGVRDTEGAFQGHGGVTFYFDPSGSLSGTVLDPTDCVGVSGYEEVADGWHRVWYGCSSNYVGNTEEDDRFTIDMISSSGAGWFMRPMFEILGQDSTLTNPPRAYQEVDGVWDLGVTSIPEHQCATALQTQINDYYGAASHVCSSTFEGGRVVDSTITTPQNANTSIQHLGDGWYNVIMSASGLADSRNFEGDRVRMIIYPTEFISDRNETCFGLIGQPFLGLTGDLNTSSVDYKP